MKSVTAPAEQSDAVPPAPPATPDPEQCWAELWHVVALAWAQLPDEVHRQYT